MIRTLTSAAALLALALTRLHAQAVTDAPCGRDSASRTAPSTPSTPSTPSASSASKAAAPGIQANDDKRVAVTIFAEASAGEVRFNSQPRVHVRLCGALDSLHVVDRRNLPSPVVAGTTYRNVYVAVEIFGRINADCIARTLTRDGAHLDCASLEFRGLAPNAGSADTARTKPPRG